MNGNIIYNKAHNNAKYKNKKQKRIKLKTIFITHTFISSLLRSEDCTHAQRGISEIDHTHSCVMRYNPLVCIYPSASPRDNRKLVGYIGA